MSCQNSPHGLILVFSGGFAVVEGAYTLRVFMNPWCLLLLERLTFVLVGDIMRSNPGMVGGLMRAPFELERRE